MKKVVIIGIVIAALVGAAFYAGLFTRESAQAAGAQGNAGGQGAAGARQGGRGDGFQGGGFGRGGRSGAGPLTVELATATRGTVRQRIIVVGNLIGDATVAVVPRVGGRLQEISVQLGDRVRRGQRIAKIEDFELQQQVKQAEAAQEVSQATIRQREADLKLAETNAERSRNLFARQLLPKQTLDDTEARYQAAVAQLDLARAQATQSNARLDELRITLDNTIITSPVNGFVARRGADPGAFVSQNAPIADVVDITPVRLVAHVVEKNLKEIRAGDQASVEVDAYPGETFMGRIARVAPVLDPQTRTASIEIEVPNPDFRLKPGMYARIGITTGERKDTLVVPINAVIDLGGRRGVYLAQENNTATFRPVRVGIEEATQVEILDGLAEGDRVVTTGAGALREGDRFLVAGAREGRDGEGGGEARQGERQGRRGGTSGRNTGAGAASSSASQQVDGGAQRGGTDAVEGASPRGGRQGEFGQEAGAARRGGGRRGGFRGQRGGEQ
jgi:RND family efflux transporter MFP subunit